MQRLSKDEGAVAVLVAILATVTVGLGAFVVDLGILYAERRQLQNAADAGVLAAVQDCASAVGCTDGGALAVAELKANQNSNDGLSAVLAPRGPAVCGIGSALTSCDPASGLGSWDCPPVRPGPLGENYVQVRTATLRLDAESPTMMPPRLARVLAPGYEGATVRACARASWGGPSAINNSLALTISYCEWDVATAGGTDYAPPPPTIPAVTYERVLKLHTTTSDTTACPAAGHSGFDGPGSFGFLADGETKDCQTDVSTSGEYSDDGGASSSQQCADALLAAWESREPVYLPVYKSYADGTYQLEGFTAFVVTGYRIPAAGKKESWLYPDNPEHCFGSDFCVYGYFTEGLVAVAGVVGGPSMGVTVYQLSG